MRLGANNIRLQATNLGQLNVRRTHLLFDLLFMKLLFVEDIFGTFCGLDGYGMP